MAGPMFNDVVVAMFLVGRAASFIPARRARSIHPMSLLRKE